MATRKDTKHTTRLITAVGAGAGAGVGVGVGPGAVVVVGAVGVVCLRCLVGACIFVASIC